MIKKKPKAPIECRDNDEICNIPRDNVSTSDFWMLTDGHTVTIKQQRNGEAPTAGVSVPRETFDAFVRWYTTGRWRKPREKGRAGG